MIPSLKTPDRYERAVAFYVNTFDNVSAERPTVGTSYPDVRITFNNTTSWLEVKMNEQDQMGNPRVMFDGDIWTGKNSPVQNFTSSILNASDSAESFISDLRDFLKTDVKIPTTKGGLKDPAAVPLLVMDDFLSTRKDKYVCKAKDIDLGDLITQHYNFGKAEPAHYIQAGDQFFALGDENPFDLDVPKLEAQGHVGVRITPRTEFYEVQPEIKIRHELYSPFSVAPGTLKPHPFVYNLPNL